MKTPPPERGIVGCTQTNALLDSYEAQVIYLNEARGILGLIAGNNPLFKHLPATVSPNKRRRHSAPQFNEEVATALLNPFVQLVRYLLGSKTCRICYPPC